MGKDIASLIINNLQDNPDYVGSIGKKFQDIVEETDENLTEYEEQIVFYKGVEEKGNLAHFDYDGWNELPKVVRDRIVDLLDPLFLSGVWFEYDKFEDFAPVIFSRLKIEDFGITVYVHGKTKVYMFLMFMSGSSNLGMGDRKFKELRQRIENQVVRTYGVINNELIIKEITHEHSTE